MIDTIQDIHIEEINGEFVATVPKIGTTVTGSTHDEALTNAQRAIMSRMIAEAEKRKRREKDRIINSSLQCFYTSLSASIMGKSIIAHRQKELLLAIMKKNVKLLVC